MTGAAGGVLLAPSPRLWRIPALKGFFPDAQLDLAPVPLRRPAGVLGWGANRPQSYAGQLARATGAAYVAVSDGLVRSVGVPGSGAAPVSLLVDELGHHDDPSRPSRLEMLIEPGGWETGALLDEACELMAFKRREGLSRFNAAGAPDLSALAGAPRTRVLVVEPSPAERRAADAQAMPDLLGAMLSAARSDHPNAQIILLGSTGKSGRGRSTPSLAAGAPAADLVMDGDVDLLALVDRVDAAYVQGGLVGIEALLAGRPVSCFGEPFYAGWGLTDDRGPPSARRTRRLSVEALFAAAYLLYPRYVDPLTGKPCTARLAFERLATFKRHANRVAGRWAGVDLPPVKYRPLRAFLEGPLSTYSPKAPKRRDFPADTRFAVWASWLKSAERAATLENVVSIEDGFLRSVGLGSNFHLASSLVLDERGIYYDPSTASDLEVMLNSASFDDRLLEQARGVRAAVVEMGLSKYNLPLSRALDLRAAGSRRTILVPGQVEDDASVRAGGAGWTNLDLLTAVRAANPAAYILFKEHPDVTAGNRVGRVPTAQALALANQLVGQVDVAACIEAVDEIHTLTSLTGFEALLRGKPVTTYGLPFYGGWGLTDDRLDYPRPRRRLGLDELTAGVLLLYPLYLDPVSRLPCDPRTYVERLRGMRRGEYGRDRGGFWLTQARRGVRAAAQMILLGRPRAY